MRIIQVIHSYFPKIGGIELAVQHLAEEQARLGHDVTVITATLGADTGRKEEILNGVRIIRLYSKKILYNDLIFPLEELPIVEADIVHVHSQNSLFSILIAEKLKKNSTAKIVFHFMAVDSYRSYSNRLLRIFASFYGRKNAEKALRIADLSVVRSMRDLAVLRGAYGVKAKFLPDAIQDSTLSLKRKDPVEFRKRFGITQPNIFLFIGRLHKLKGPHILVEALKYLNKDFAAVFIGPDGGYLRDILELAENLCVQNRIYILGYVNEETKIAAIDSATALVNTSMADHVEVYSIVLSEAWAREKPVVASKIGEVAYRVKQGINGILVPPSNPEILANAMMAIIKDKEGAAKMGLKGKASVLSWESIAKKSIDLYEQVLGHKRF